MIKKQITYTDYDGNERTESFWFALNQAELLEMNLEKNGGLSNMITRITETNDYAELSRILKDLIRRSYGVKSDDGKRFVKSPAMTEEFMQTEAYSEMFTELVMDAGATSEFIQGIIPQKLAAQVMAEQKKLEAVK
jgi:hypothetical protein